MQLCTRVVRPGDCCDPTLPRSNAFPFAMTKGATVALRVCVLNCNGTVYTIQESDTFVLTAAPQGCTYPPGFKVTVLGSDISPADRANGCVTFSINSAKTLYLCSGSYVYDVWLRNSGVREVLIPLSLLSLQPSLALP